MTLPQPVEQARSPTATRRLIRPGTREPEAALLHGGRRVALPPTGLTLGREADNEIVLDGAAVSRHHTRVGAEQGRWFVADLDSTNGTFLNGERLRGEARWLESGDTIAVGGEVLRFVEADAERDQSARVPVTGRVTIGRAATNDIRLPGAALGAVHAEVVRSNGRVEVIDRGTRLGTRLDGVLVERAELETGDEIGVGPYRFVYDGEGLIERDERGALRLEAEQLSLQLRGSVLLEPLSLSIPPGELVAVIGESGSGKSTLLKLLAGVTSPSGGRVLLNGDPVTARRGDIGYLPQDEIVHPRLRVVESLAYSARLRLPPDSTRPEIEAAVASALGAVALERVATQPIRLLSGGQRKRVGLATELLSEPGVLLLDEPTTGLDVGLERQMMELFRSLASVGGHTVVLVTHATHSLDRVDRLCVMGRGGVLCFSGPPVEALRFFGVESFEEIYVALQEGEPSDWRERFERLQAPSTAPPPAPSDARRARAATLRSFPVQTATLTSRYLRVFLRDRLNLGLLVAQAPVLGLTLLLLFRRDVFGPPGRGSPLVATQLLFLLVMITIWVGAVDASREIVKERVIVTRERAMGVSIGAFLASKVIVLFTLILLQAATLLGLTALLRPFHEPVSSYLAVFGLLAVTGFAAVGMGLLVSTVAQNEDQATALAPIAMTMQLLVGGGIVTVKSMTGLMAAVSTTSFGRWAFEAVGTRLHMDARFLSAGVPPRENAYGLTFFRLGSGEAYLLLVGFTLLFFATISVLLSRTSSGSRRGG